MAILKILLLIIFGGLLVFSVFNIIEDIVITGFKSLKKKSFVISLVAFGFSLFLVIKAINGIF